MANLTHVGIFLGQELTDGMSYEWNAIVWQMDKGFIFLDAHLTWSSNLLKFLLKGIKLNTELHSSASLCK